MPVVPILPLQFGCLTRASIVAWLSESVAETNFRTLYAFPALFATGTVVDQVAKVT